MANWWEAAPLAPQQAQSPANWWEAAPLAQPQTNAIEQGTTGINEGIAQMLGLPGMGMSALVNMGLAAESGNDPAGPVQMPEIGGPEFYQGVGRDLGLISETDPQTAGQRIARRVGQDVGAGALAAPVAGVSSLGGLALNTAADVGSGLAGGLTSEVTDDPIANIIASLLGGGSVVGASRAARPGPQAPSNEALRAVEDALWQRVRDSNVRLTPRATQELQGNVSAKAFDMRMKPSLHGPEATAAVDEIWSLPSRPSLWEIEEARRFVGDSTPVGYDKASTARITTGLKREIDDYLSGIPHPDARIADEARDISRRRIASEKLDRTLDRAERQAARANNGANVVNSQRQRIDAILNSPKDRASYKPSEIEQMEAIVRGTPGTNAARFLGSISPTRGGFYAGGNAGLVGGVLGASGGDPVLTALAATPGAISAMARHVGESLTDQQIKKLSSTIRNGGTPLPGKTLTEGEQAVVRALLMVGASEHAPN